jgi:Tfp pilus assembly protein PilX
MKTIRAHLLADDGIAMIVAICVLLVVSLLMAAAVAIGVQTVGSSRRDSYRKSALEAAEAGLQIASYRLNMLDPANASSQNTKCVGDAVASPDSTGTCASSVTTLGNGSSYQYWTTPVLGAGNTCVGLTLTSASSLAQRCVTAVGTSNGISARSQIRVAAFTAAPLFPVAGVTGLKSVSLDGGAVVHGSGASNVTVSAVGNSTATGNVLGPAGVATTTGNASLGATTRLTNPLVLDPVAPGNSVTVNNDSRITNGLASPVLSPYDQASGNVSWNPSTRSLSLSGQNSSLTLGGAVYNFCSLSVSGNANITLAPGTSAEVIIDSPDDPGSGCPAGSGTFSLSGQATWTNVSANPLNLEIFVYGNNDGSNKVTFVGNAAFYGLLYAPLSTVDISGNGGFTGAISGANVALHGNAFNYSSSASIPQGSTNGAYYRSAWAQCSPTAPTASQPGSGCG